MEGRCLPSGVGEDQFSELELGGTGTKELCAGGNAAGHEACCEKFWLDLPEQFRKKKNLTFQKKKKGSILFLIFMFMIKINNFKLMVFDIPQGRNSNNFKDADVVHRYFISRIESLFLPSYKEKELKTIKNHEIIREKHII